MACDGGAVFKLVELILCVVCLVYKRYTDNEAIRVFYQLEKLSREWPLLNNITWDENGALLADVTFGGFALITLGLLIGQVCGELKRTRRMVCFFLVVGCIMFLIVGGLCLAALDQVPHHLVDNAIVLGILSIITGLLFLIDLATTGNKKSATSSSSAQNKKPVKVISSPTSAVVEENNSKTKDKKSSGKDTDEKAKKKIGNGVLKELRSSLKRKKTVEDLDGRGVVVEKPDRNVEFEGEKDSKMESERVERSGDANRQYGRRGMENRGFPRTASDDSGRFSSDRFRNDFVDAERDRRFDRDFDRADSRNVSVVEGTYDSRRSRPASMMEVELDEHYLRPQDYYIEKRVTKEDQRQRVQDQRVSSSRQDLSDDEYQSQLPSVSFLLSERGRKVLPSVSTSPVERLQEITSTSMANGKPRYYYNSRDPASGSSAPPSPRTPGYLHTDPPSPRAPGYVLQTASHWEDPDKGPTTVSDRLHHWFRNRHPGKAP